jgi:hypothetical protein
MLTNLDIPIPDIVHSYDENKQKEIVEYLSYVKKDELLKKAYIIAFQHLGSSFNIYKSNGFKEWNSSKCIHCKTIVKHHRSAKRVKIHLQSLKCKSYQNCEKNYHPAPHRKLKNNPVKIPRKACLSTLDKWD